MHNLTRAFSVHLHKISVIGDHQKSNESAYVQSPQSLICQQITSALLGNSYNWLNIFTNALLGNNLRGSSSCNLNNIYMQMQFQNPV